MQILAVQTVVLIIVSCNVFVGNITATKLNDNPLLLLISFGGFRYDLLNETLVPHIWKFASEGFVSKQLTNFFLRTV